MDGAALNEQILQMRHINSYVRISVYKEVYIISVLSTYVQGATIEDSLPHWV